MADGGDLKSIDFSSLLSHLKNQKAFLERHRGILDSHMVDFFTENLWEKLLTPGMCKSLLCLSSDELSSLPTSATSSTQRSDLTEFIKSAKAHQLTNWDWVRCRDIFMRDQEDKPPFIDYCMKPKKSYEVELMSEVVNSLATQYNIRTILDLGSGKGYLSHYLAMQYGLHVIGIDCSPSNTENAKKRNAKVNKMWSHLKSKADSSQHVQQKLECNDRELRNVNSDLPSNIATSVHQSVKSREKEFVMTCTGCCVNKKEKNLQSADCAEEEVRHSVQENCTKHQFSECSGFAMKSMSEMRTCCHHSTKSLDDKESSFSGCSANCLNLPSRNKNTLHCCWNRLNSGQQHCKHSENKTSKEYLHNNCSNQHSCTACDSDSTILERGIKDEKSFKQDGGSYVPVTGFVESSSLSSALAAIQESDSDQQKDRGKSVFIVGLHTCGNLGPTALRMFINNPQVGLLCVVGCCYHLLLSQDNNDSSELEFPLSAFLKEQQFHLSRNATMVAQQAANKLASENKLPPKSILYRAVLQVMLKEKYGLDGKGYHVGRIGAKCKTFSDYVHKAVKKLGLEGEQISEEEIASYLERFNDREQEINAFHQVRAILAPCIESLIVLDRLCFLYEQNADCACVVRLFDPAKSPRCYAIVAAKNDDYKVPVTS